jgi:L-fucose isomerase-like protein
MHLAFIPIARPTFDVTLASDMAARAYENLQSAGFSVDGSPDLIMDMDAANAAAQNFAQNPPDLLLIFQASFADSTMVAMLAEKVPAPVMFWAVPEERVGGRLRLNSFCGINLAGHSLRRAGFVYDYVYAPPDDASAINKIQAVARAAVTKKRLMQTRIGRIGENPAGFDTCLVNHDALKRQLGVEVVQLSLDDAFAAARSADAQKVAAIAGEVRARVADVDTLDETATNGTFSTYVALRGMADDQGLDGLAVRCWPEFFTEMGCSACGAMSMLSDGLTPASCEADVNGTITQFILQSISGQAAFGSDLVAFDADEDVAILWHCGLAPLSMADPDVQPRATIHSNRKMPLLMEFPLKPGRVTLARLSEATGELRLVVAGGQMIQAPPSFTGTTGTLRFDCGTSAAMDTILREGLEHHLSLTYGDHIESLLVLARMLDLPVLIFDRDR